MRILVTGGTGLIGSALLKYWRDQHQITVLTRQPVARLQQTSAINYVNSLKDIDFNQLDAIVNLAGEPIADKRWTEKQKHRICQSRWHLTEQLTECILAASTPPSCLINGSAVGYYGRQGSEFICEEHSAFYPEFSHDICARWENIALQAASEKTRVCLLRTGIVLSDQGGALKKMLPAFRFGLGGPLGSGQQYMSWIHIDDIVKLIDFLLHSPTLQGPFNAVAPKAVTNKQFSQALAERLNRPAKLTMPAFILRLMFGEMADILLFGQRVVPQQALDAGFKFQYPKLPAALADLDI
ncbi:MULTISPECIES: TIGR01777 family oxidoreductase [unclassified Arsukibacterium]|mgnify:CR=1 FL=1|uniref:TIGR01777 family oxidoreductase n=1 Tax=unclassified Arsukibacterium TaxID=2635278 RepID=UPI000C90F569|nr:MULTISPECIES: TIGR01777 family oxidoreductase [unclassified Arsukibacterium]MAA96474.1 TIGR01777 family protein [Rheinheimera sp.]|tara:strand:- start:178 stop:1068 length:891 start_codon:yes stop_codon:yes gene_type:complete